MYDGVGVAILGPVLYRGLYFGVYDTAKEYMPRGYMAKVLVANTITLSLGFLTYPLDTITHRLQLQAERKPEHRLYRGAFDCLRQIATKEGLHALWHGSASVWLGVVNGLGLVLADELMQLLKTPKKF